MLAVHEKRCDVVGVMRQHYVKTEHIACRPKIDIEWRLLTPNGWIKRLCLWTNFYDLYFS